MSSFILLCFADVAFAFYFIFLVTYEEQNFVWKIVWFYCIWKKLISEGKPLLIRQNDWGIDTMIMWCHVAGNKKKSQNLPVQVIILEKKVTVDCLFTKK